MASAAVKTLWKKIRGFAGRYEVNNFGGVWSNVSHKMLRPGRTTAGYLTVNLVGRSYYVHRLVAQAFIPNPERKRTVNHKREPRSDNRKTNLEWATYGENHAHAYKHLGRKAAASRAVVNGEGQRFESAAAAARAFNRTTGAICIAVRGGTMSAGTFWWLA